MKIKTIAMMMLCVGFSSQGNSAGSMAEVFDQINAQGNITAPVSIQGQTMGYVGGGSVFMRSPSNTYNLASITPPSANASCGGIDLYMGGFSYVNKAQFVSMMKNIGSAALGYGFKLALQNICPTCDNVMQALQSTAQQINRMNIDSCEAARGIVNAAPFTENLKGREQSSMSMGTVQNMFTDISDAWEKNKGKDSTTTNTLNQVTQANPDLKMQIPEGNITWKAISKLNAMTTEQKYLVMGLTGTVIFSEENGKSKPLAYSRRITNISQLIGTANSTGNQFEVYKCADSTAPDGCKVLSQDTIVIQQNFYKLVDDKMKELMNAMRNRQPLNNSADLIQFINLTDIPIYKLIALNTQYGATNDAAQNAVGAYKELIAAKYALRYFEIVSRETENALTGYQMSTLDASTANAIKELKENLDKTRNDLNATTEIAYSRASVTYNIAQSVQHMERTLQSNIAPTLRQSIVFGNSLTK